MYVWYIRTKNTRVPGKSKDMIFMLCVFFHDVASMWSNFWGWTWLDETID